MSTESGREEMGTTFPTLFSTKSSSLNYEEMENGETNPNVAPVDHENAEVRFRNSLKSLFHSHKFHLLIIALVIVDCLVVITGLIIEVNLLSKGNEEKHASSVSTQEDVAHVLHYVSLSILCIFIVEILFKIYAFQMEFVKNKMEMFDMFIIVVSFVFDLIFLKQKNTTSIIGDLIIVLRLWRIVRVIHGIVLSVKTPIEDNLAKEKKHREEAENQLQGMKQYVSELESEILKLREVLKHHQITTEIPNFTERTNVSSK